MKKLLSLCSLGLASLLTAPTFGQLYSEDFEVDPTANWTVNDPAATDIEVDFFYDYSAIGVPPAPGGLTTRGLKMTANNTDGVFGGFTTSPTGESFNGDYQVKFNLWQNYLGPAGPGGSGTTQLSLFGIGTSGTVAQTPGFVDESVEFAVTLDGGSSVDYRVYSSDFIAGHPDGDPVFSSGGGRNGSDPHYAGFGGQSPPAAQTLLYPAQTGSTDSGEIAFDWVEVTIDVVGGIATWSIDGLEIAEIDTASLNLGGGNILFGHNDTNNSSSSDGNSSLLNVTLIDNIVVTRIPEPSSLMLLSLGGLALVRRRR